MNLSISRRQFLKTATFAAGALLAGCGPKGAPGARVTLTQWYHQYGETGTQDAVLRYAREYTKQHPGIAVRVIWIPGDYSTKLGTALLTRNGPDVFESTLSEPMVTAGEVAPLDDLFTPEIRADFNPKDLEINSVGGRIYGVKMFDDTAALYYRKSLLEKAGVDPPRTMDALIAAVKKLNTDDRKGLFVGNDGGVGSLINIAPWSAGSDFLVDGHIVFDNPRTAAAYEKVLELNATGALLLGAPTDWYDPSALTQGLAAMQWTGLWAYPAIRKALGDDVGVLPWPALDAQGTPATFLGGWSSMVNAQSPNVDEAKKYVKWLWIERADLQKDWCLSYGFHVPARPSVARTADALRATVPQTAAHNMTVYGHALPPSWNSAMNTALTDAATHILKEGRPAAGELANAARKCEIVLRRMQE
ncbi:sugar ABC transporter substrate-binding protein [Capsulimonas corticalis]|uniref:Sugar ABC transporter substrate-binding protein n=1 Tax=Capsulimonas corticalis TaxID=2219043 RepID=A0A402CV00_9BACT|nr:sugar ABC transporter substrate-binding protein [Capsulimonas corticalis]BDI30224.1 sugar ABC transporter substrate-binding protein [Capsulimonas corticalis]